MAVTKIISIQSPYKNHIHVKETSAKNGKNTHGNSPLITMLKKITNSNIQFKKPSFGNILHKSNNSHANPFSNRGRVQVIDSKTVKNYISQKLQELDLPGKGKEDPIYASQAFDAILASVYSNKKDEFCIKMIEQGLDTSSFLKEAGEAAKTAGLKGKMHNGIFEPAGAGANPFLTPLISSSQQKYPYTFINKNQQAFFKGYAEKNISIEMGEICKEKGMIRPAEFGKILEEIANRYLSDMI